MGPNSSETLKKVHRTFFGRLQLAVLGSIVLTAGLVYDKWWWQAGLMFLIVLAIEALFFFIVLD